MDLSKPKKGNEPQTIMIQKKGSPGSLDILSRCTYPMSHYFSRDPTTTKISEIANKIANNNKARAEIREEILMLKDYLNDWPTDGETRTITWTEWSENYVPFEYTATLTKEGVKNLISNMENQLNRFTDIMYDLNLQLQEAMTEQAEVMQMMSSVMKTQHDTLKAIIRNLRA